jgi:hypothetical protein
MSYYKNQLNQLNPAIVPSIKIKTDDTETKWMNINVESAQDIIDWLTTNYITPNKGIDFTRITNDVVMYVIFLT